MRFDMRAQAQGDAVGELYAAALDMAEWGERNGCLAVQVSEHHASPDGYLPAPLLLAAGMAARTRKLPLQVAALLVPLHDPVALAEQMAVLDLLSSGRVSYVCALGYRPEEYAMFGRDMSVRGRSLERSIEILRRAWTGEPFEVDGRPCRVTPRPLTPGGPPLLMGGGSPGAVRRAARLGMGVITQGGDPELGEVYRSACRKLGREPGVFVHPPEGSVTSAFVSDDPERSWAELGPYLLYDARMYARWMGEAPAAIKSAATSVEELRRENGPYRIFTPEEAVAYLRQAGVLVTQPLCGGMPPELAWPCLELLAAEVLPALRPDGS